MPAAWCMSGKDVTQITHECTHHHPAHSHAWAIAGVISMSFKHVIIACYLRAVYALVRCLQLLCQAHQYVRSFWTGGKHAGSHATSGGSAPAPARHLAIVIAEHEPDQVSDRDAARVLQWCYAAGMDLVLLYDPAGHLKQASGYLEQRVACVHSSGGDRLKCRPVDVQAGWRQAACKHHKTCNVAIQQPCQQGSELRGSAEQLGPPGPTTGSSNQQAPGTCKMQHACTDSPESCQQGLTPALTQSISRLGTQGRGEQGRGKGGEGGTRRHSGGVSDALVPSDMRVVLLSAEDAYSPVLEMVAGTAAQHAGTIKTDARSHQEAGMELMHRIQAVAGAEAAMEPQLILVYSHGPLTLAGFPPWLARTAEILAMGPLSTATESGFVAALNRFSSIKQRFGR